MLDHYLPEGYLKKEEMDQKSVLRGNWKKLADQAEVVTDYLADLQKGFKKELLKNIKEFVGDVDAFREDFVAAGPMVPGTTPAEAVQRLQRYQEEFAIRWRKYELYSGGEELFALKQTAYPELLKTKKELALLTQLYGLYTDVLGTIAGWKEISWVDVPNHTEEMGDMTEKFEARCKKLPGKLRDWEAYITLKKEIEDFTIVLPLITELTKDSIKPRHWTAVMDITNTTFEVDTEDFKVRSGHGES